MRAFALLLAVACGGSEFQPSHAVVEQTAACDFCPGAVSTRVLPDPNGPASLKYCRCANGQEMYFQINPPVNPNCAHYQCEFAQLCATGNLATVSVCPL